MLRYRSLCSLALGLFGQHDPEIVLVDKVEDDDAEDGVIVGCVPHQLAMKLWVADIGMLKWDLSTWRIISPPRHPETRTLRLPCAR
jgi:hypothetical protein